MEWREKVGRSTGGDKAASEKSGESPSLAVVFHRSLTSSPSFVSDRQGQVVPEGSAYTIKRL